VRSFPPSLVVPKCMRVEDKRVLNVRLSSMCACFPPSLVVPKCRGGLGGLKTRGGLRGLKTGIDGTPCVDT
jgi:hypothetical protein